MPQDDDEGGSEDGDEGDIHQLLLRLITSEREGDPVAPLLDMLTATTGLECVYLTRIDGVRNRQWVVTSRHAHQHGVVVPEGGVAPWDQALCRCALEDHTPATDEAHVLWPHNPFRVAHGIRSFVSEPVLDQAGQIRGTLCLASQASRPVAAGALELVGLFARIIGCRLDRDAMVAAAQRVFERCCRQNLDGALAGLDDPERVAREVRRVFRLPQPARTSGRTPWASAG